MSENTSHHYLTQTRDNARPEADDTENENGCGAGIISPSQQCHSEDSPAPDRKDGMTGVHPSAFGVPPTSPPVPNSSREGPRAFNGSDYPGQLHAGRLDGLGPAYNKLYTVTMSDRLKGFKEKIHGTLTGDPELKEKGQQRMSGELKRREREEEEEHDPFAT